MSRSQALSVSNPSSWIGLLTGKPPAGSSASSKVMSGSFIMLVGSTLVSGFNFIYNVAMARLLGPALFGHVTAAATILMLFSAVTLSFQLVCAKFVARNTTAYGQMRVYQKLIRRSWAVGISLCVLLAAFTPQLTRYLRLPSPWIMLMLAGSFVFYVPLGVRRGWMQGKCEFHALTWNLVIEAALKLVASLPLVFMGYGLLGAVGALALSVIGAYVITFGQGPQHIEGEAAFEPASFLEGIQATVFFIGQVVISNIDIFMVKHFFDASDAGLYASIALVGRVLYLACWSVLSAMFPLSAAAEREEGAWQVLRWPLFVVTGMSTLSVAVLALFPRIIMHLVFGSHYSQSGQLLALYAALTGIYALAVTLITFEMSRKIANTGWLQLVFSGLLVLGIVVFHDSLRQVILVRSILMLGLLALVSAPFLMNLKRGRAPEDAPHEPDALYEEHSA